MICANHATTQSCHFGVVMSIMFAAIAHTAVCANHRRTRPCGIFERQKKNFRQTIPLRNKTYVCYSCHSVPKYEVPLYILDPKVRYIAGHSGGTRPVFLGASRSPLALVCWFQRTGGSQSRGQSAVNQHICIPVLV